MQTTTERTELSARQTYDSQLKEFESRLLSYLSMHGLPTDSVLVSVRERVTVLSNVEFVLEKIPHEQRQRSLYLSKYLSAVAAGLFDAALNYLWDETIAQLRHRVSQYDLSYFYDNAVSNSEKRKDLNTEGDLEKLDDSSLIYGAKSIELISDIGFRHLDYIRSMRNWASAAHPNQNTLTGLQLIGWLETCIIEVISLPLSNIVVEIGRLLGNVKANSISAEDARNIAGFFANLTQDQINKLSSGLYGIYTRADTTQRTRENIHNLIPYLWERVSEGTKQQFGTKYGRFVANNDEAERELARQFLDMVSGQSYIPDALRAAEIETAVDNLLVAHRGRNNFHNEPTFARALRRLVGAGKVPRQVDTLYVLGLVEVFLTNGFGVAVNAQPVYVELLNGLNKDQSILAVLSRCEQHIASRLQFDRSGRQYRELLAMMKTKVPPAARELIDDIEAYEGPLYHLKDDSRIIRKVLNLKVLLSSQ